MLGYKMQHINLKPQAKAGKKIIKTIIYKVDICGVNHLKNTSSNSFCNLFF